MSRIDLRVYATGNFSQVQSELARLRAQISAINASGIAGVSPAAMSSITAYTTQFGQAMQASGMFQTRMVNLTSETERFGKALERGNLRLGQYFKEGSKYIRRQQGQIQALAREQVRMMNSTAVGLGGGQAMVVTPKGIDEAINKQRILNREHQIFRQVLNGGSTALVNWGKNTQWAGRQLMVGLTLPLTVFGALAAKTFLDANKELTRLAKVYGDAAKGAVSGSELEKIKADTLSLAQEISKTMGVAVNETLGIAADIAATGKEGNELLAATNEAMRLSVLGEVDRQEAMRATLSIQNVFKKDSKELADSINFLNAVENQTSTSLNDLVTGIVKAGPVVQGLGGDIEELALMMTAMREGGIPASEAANAIKSSLASLINPTKETTKVLSGFGINLKEIVDKNAGDIIGTLVSLQDALSGLDDLSRQRSIEQIFGKFQFSRINQLLTNINRAGSQTEQVYKIAGMSVTQLAQTAAGELSVLTESASGRFKRAVEGIKASLIPIGETFLNIGTTILEVGKSIFDVFNNIPGPIKLILNALLFGGAIVGPILMLSGLMGNFVGNIMKGVVALLKLKKSMRGLYTDITPESIAAQNASNLLTRGFYEQDKATQILRAGIDGLTNDLKLLQGQMLQTGGASANMLSATMGAAERNAAAVAMGYGSVAGYLTRGGKDAGKTNVRTFGGPEFSHLHPSSRLPEELKRVQTIGTLVPGGSPAATFQRQMNDKFLPQFYDPSGGRTRMQILEQMALSARNEPALQTVRGTGGRIGINESEAARLLPTRQEYNAYVAQYHASLKRLESMGVAKLKQLSEQITRATSRGDIAGAEKALERALYENKAQFDRFFAAELVEIEKVNGTLEQVTAAAAGRSAMLEGSIAKTGVAGFRANAGGDTLFRLISANAGGGIGAPVVSGPQTKAQQEYQAALHKAATATQMQTKWEESLGIATQKVESLRKSLNASESELNSLTKRMSSSSQNYTRIVDENGNVFYENKTTGQRLSLANSKAAANLEMLATLRHEVATTTHNLALWESKLASITQRQGAVADYATRAEQEKIAAEQNLTAETRKLSNARIKQILKESAITDTVERTKVRSSLRKLDLALLEEVQKINLHTTKQGQVAALLDEGGLLLGAFNVSTRKLINAEELAALGLTESDIMITQEERVRGILIAELNKQAQTYRLSEDDIQRLVTYINGLSSEVLQTTESLELVKAGARKLAIQLNAASGRTTPATTPSPVVPMGGPAFNPKVMGATMGVGMLAGMGTMFLPQDGGAVSKIAGGAMMGASMGTMAGMMSSSVPGAIAGIVGGTAIGAAIPALKELSDVVNDAAMSTIKYSEAINGSSLIIDAFSKEIGTIKPTDSLAAAIGQIESPEKTISEGLQLLDTEAGKQLLNLSKQFAGTELVDALRNQLKQLTLLEIFTPEQAKSVANALAYELKQPTLGNALIEGINSVLDENGMIISDKVAEMFASSIPKFDFTNMPTGPAPGGSYDYAGASAIDAWAKQNIPAIASGLDKLREAQALVTKEFMDGSSTYEEYITQMSSIRNEQASAANALNQLMSSGVNDWERTNILAAIAEAGGITEEFKSAEIAAQKLMETLTAPMPGGLENDFIQILGGREDTFFTQIQIAASYGDITESELNSLVQMAQDPDKKTTLSALFQIDGATENSIEIIKLINSGMDADFMFKIMSNAEEINQPLDQLYASLVALSALPKTLQQEIVLKMSDHPEYLPQFISNYEYAMSLPDTDKELRAEVFGNSDLEVFKDNWEAFVDMDSESRKTAVFNYMVSGTYDFTPAEIPMPSAVTELTQPDISSMVDAAFPSGSGGGGGDSGVSDRYDKLIEAQDKIIEKIKEEREERQKLLDKEKEALDFALREQDLKNKIAQAKAEGRLADAALLQSELDAERKKKRQDEAEQRRVEEEDRRIKAAEEEKKRLEDEKSAATGGSGGSGGGGDNSAAKEAMQRQIQFLNDELNAALLGSNGLKIMDAVVAEGIDAFWDSEPVVKYTEALKKLGVPARVIREQLEAIYDEMVNKAFGDQGIKQFDRVKESLEEVGLSGETLQKTLPNVFGILSDPEMGRQETLSKIISAFIEAGDTATEAERRAKKFLGIVGARHKFKLAEDFEKEMGRVLDPDDAEMASREYLAGVKKGSTAKQILDSISDSIFKATFEDGIKRGLNADTARGQAQSAANAVVATIEKNSDRFLYKVKGEWTGIVNGAQIPPVLRGLFGEDGKFFGTADTAHEYAKNSDFTFNTEIDVNQTTTIDNSYSKPLYVSIVSDYSGTGGSPIPGRAYGGLMKFSYGSDGSVRGPGTSMSDSIPAMLSNGEYVIRASSVAKFGVPFFDALNAGMFPELARGGMSRYPGMIAGMSRGGYSRAMKAMNNLTESHGNQYNINVNVEGTNASADDIANKVMQAMKTRENMNRSVTRI